MIDIKTREKQLRDRLAALDIKLHDIEHTLDKPMPKDFADRASEREEDEVLESLGVAGQQKQAMIEAALARIDEGEYGYCMACGEKISEERLDVLPYTPKCKKCAK